MKTKNYYYDEASGIWCHEITDYLSFNVGNCFKYLFRAGRKTANAKGDLEKALDYAKQSQRNGDDVPEEAKELIERVAKYRPHADNRKHAMLWLAVGDWKMAIGYIELELRACK